MRVALSWLASHCSSDLSRTESFDRRTNKLLHRAAGAERHRGADDPAIDVLHQIVALGGGHELGGQQLLALLVDHAHQHVEHAAVLAEQARDRLLHQAEAILHQRRLDAAHPDLVGRLLARVLFLMIDDLDAVAAACLRAAACGDRIVDRHGRIGLARIDHADADAAGAGDLLVADAKHLRRDLAHEIVRPRLDVARRAALHQQHQRAVAEAADQIGRLAGLVRRGRRTGR